jgi:hypothetical protein
VVVAALNQVRDWGFLIVGIEKVSRVGQRATMISGTAERRDDRGAALDHG